MDMILKKGLGCGRDSWQQDRLFAGDDGSGNRTVARKRPDRRDR